MIVIMAVIGAITRLTESGLSITEWQPVKGFLPPLHQADWEKAFEGYKQIPEFQQQNSWMSLDDFKNIYWWEWIHRFWGRLIGIAYALPLLFFWVRGMVPQNFKLPLLGILLLGGTQGVMGWFMVMSGLSERLDVSHYRLAAHLMLAFILYVCVLLTIFKLQGRTTVKGKTLHWLFALLLLVMVWGAFTAGLNGGLLYNTYPKMGAGYIPVELHQPFAFLDNPAGVQFVHRWLATILAGLLLYTGWARKNYMLMAVALIQPTLGIFTLLFAVPVWLGALHQLGAFILGGVLLHAIYGGNNQDRLQQRASL